MKTTYFLLLIFLPITLLSQKNNNGDSLKFEMIKRTLEFLSTDSRVRINGPSSTRLKNCHYSDGYTCLMEYADAKIDGGKRKVKEWQGHYSATKAEVKNLAEFIISDITASNDRKYRKNLDTYAAFENTLLAFDNKFETKTAKSPTKNENKDISSGTIQSPAIADEDAANLNKEPQSNVVQTDQKSNQTAAGVNSTTDNSEINENTEMLPANEEPKQGSNLPTIAFLTSLAALVMGIWAFARSGKKPPQDNKHDMDVSLLREEIRELKMRISQKPVLDIKPLEENLRTLESRITGLETKRHSAIEEINEQNRKVKTDTLPKAQATPEFDTVFAKYPDLGNGFSESIIANEQNGERIYEIEIKGNQATFAITTNESAQKYVLGNANYYLSSACDSLNQQVEGARIVTIEKGTLAKSGNNWIIQSKAKIEFR